jgi:hypothetical protein
MMLSSQCLVMNRLDRDLTPWYEELLRGEGTKHNERAVHDPQADCLTCMLNE